MRFLLITLAVVFLFQAQTGPVQAWTDEESSANRAGSAANFKYKTVTTQEGLHFRVPEDMPIQTVNGIQVPMPFDEYMYGKFSDLGARVKSLESRLERIEKLLASTTSDSSKSLPRS